MMDNLVIWEALDVCPAFLTTLEALPLPGLLPDPIPLWAPWVPLLLRHLSHSPMIHQWFMYLTSPLDLNFFYISVMTANPTLSIQWVS